MDFIDSLKADKLLSDIEYPISYQIKESDIDFLINFKIKATPATLKMKINQQKGSSLIVILLIDALLATGVVVLIFFCARPASLAGATEIRS